jgi:hypothetical protein
MIRSAKIAMLLAGIALSSPGSAGAAAISVMPGSPIDQTGWNDVPLDADDFETSGRHGNGHSVVGSGRDVVTKTYDGQNPFLQGGAWGREELNDQGPGWIDSNDNRRVIWNVRNDEAFTSLRFRVADYADQPNSFFAVVSDSAKWRVEGELENGQVSTIQFDFDIPVFSALIDMRTGPTVNTLRRNDGFGIDRAQLKVAPVPLPAGLPLMVAVGAAFVFIGAKRGFKQKSLVD